MITTAGNEFATTDFQRVASAARWHEALLGLPQPHPLQSWSWGEFKSRWGWSARPLLMAPANGQSPEAAALVLKRKLPGLPFSILYIPKGPVLDYANEGLRRAMLGRLEQMARREKAIFIKLDPDVVISRGLEPERPSPPGIAFRDELQARGWRFSDDQIQFRNTVELDLRLSEEALLAAMKQKTRYNIRLAGRREVVVRDGGKDDLPMIAEMYRETAARDGFVIRPTAYYLDAWRTFLAAGMGHVLIAEFAGTPLGAVILVHYGQRAIYMYGASSDTERRRMPNYLLQWEAIRWAKRQGCAVYDFWGAPDEFVESDSLWGVWRFKAGFEGEVVRHIGAWDYPSRPFWYWLYTTAMPRYLAFLRNK